MQQNSSGYLWFFFLQKMQLCNSYSGYKALLLKGMKNRTLCLTIFMIQLNRRKKSELDPVNTTPSGLQITFFSMHLTFIQLQSLENENLESACEFWMALNYMYELFHFTDCSKLKCNLVKTLDLFVA